MENKIIFNSDNLKIELTNLKVDCYGAIGLMDFNYHFDVILEDTNSCTIIKQRFDDDIAELIRFCKGASCLRSEQTNCSLEIDRDNTKQQNGLQPYYVLRLLGRNLQFCVRLGYVKEDVENFKLELKSTFEYLIETYIRDNPDSNCTITKVKF